MEHLNAQNDPKQQTKCSGSKSQSCSCSQTLDVKPPKGPVVEKIEKFTLAWDSEESNPNEPDVSDGKEAETVPVEQLPDSELPGKSANTSYIQVFFFWSVWKFWFIILLEHQTLWNFTVPWIPKSKCSLNYIQNLIAYSTLPNRPWMYECITVHRTTNAKNMGETTVYMYGPFHYCSKLDFVIFYL